MNPAYDDPDKSILSHVHPNPNTTIDLKHNIFQDYVYVYTHGYINIVDNYYIVHLGNSCLGGGVF